MQYALSGMVVTSIPVPNNPDLQQVTVNFGGVQLTTNIDAADAVANWTVGAAVTVTLAPGA